MRHLSVILVLALAACAGPAEPQTFRATPIVQQPTAPLFASATAPPTRTPVPSATPTWTASPTATPTLTATATSTATATPTLLTLTAPAPDGAPAAIGPASAALAATDGWSCGDFPCEDDIDGFLRRIRVPDGFVVSHYGRFPGQPQQIAVGPDGRLYATVLEDGTRLGGVYALAEDGTVERIADGLTSPLGLAFQPGTSILYVSARGSTGGAGVLYQLLPDTPPVIALDNLPCCLNLVDNQPNGMVFGPDGWLYLGVGALTNRAEPANPQNAPFATLAPLEASVLRIQPHTGEIEEFAGGLRNPYDVTFDSQSRFYATDQGLIEGPGDRIVQLVPGANFGFPYWRTRGCEACPFTPPSLDVNPDLLTFADYTLPRGLVAYTGTQFPVNYFDTLFIALWNGVEGGQRIIHVDPAAIPTDIEALASFQPEAFMTGLIRPIDVATAPDGALLVADFIYGHVWRVRYAGAAS